MRKENSTNSINEKALQNFCNASKTLMMITGRWKLSILFKLIEDEEVNYSEFKILLPEISDRTLSRQLNELIQDHLVSKEKSKTSSQYSLTEKGKKLHSVLSSLLDFQK